MFNRGHSSENAPHASYEPIPLPPTTTTMDKPNVDPNQFNYITEAIHASFTTEFDDLLKNVKSPFYDFEPIGIPQPPIQSPLVGFEFDDLNKVSTTPPNVALDDQKKVMITPPTIEYDDHNKVTITPHIVESEDQSKVTTTPPIPPSPTINHDVADAIIAVEEKKQPRSRPNKIQPPIQFPVINIESDDDVVDVIIAVEEKKQPRSRPKKIQPPIQFPVINIESDDDDDVVVDSIIAVEEKKQPRSRPKKSQPPIQFPVINIESDDLNLVTVKPPNIVLDDQNIVTITPPAIESDDTNQDMITPPTIGSDDKNKATSTPPIILSDDQNKVTITPPIIPSPTFSDDVVDATLKEKKRPRGRPKKVQRLNDESGDVEETNVNPPPRGRNFPSSNSENDSIFGNS